MKCAFCAIFLTALVGSVSQAGYVGQINLGSAIADPNASLSVNGTGANARLTGTGLQAPSITAADSVISPLTGGYLFFNTGTYAGLDASGNTLYNAGGNFFVLQQNLAGSKPVYARDLTTDAAIVKTLTGVFYTIGSTRYQEYELTMGFSSAILNDPIATAFSSPSPGLYSGTLDFTYIVNPSSQGNQLLSGGISFDIVPEPSSLAMVLAGCAGLMGYSVRRRSLRK